jgi:hypothetical protein
MAETSVPGVIDYLVTQIRGLPECQAPVRVSDGWPAVRGDRGIAIGITPDDEEITNEVAHAQLGAQLEYEMPSVPCEIWTWEVRGDPDASTKAARDAAAVLFNAFLTEVRRDRTCGNRIHSGAALITGVRWIQTSDASAAGAGRGCEVRFVVTWKNRF